MKQTAKQRIERAVIQVFLEKTVNSDDAMRLILAERARLKRGVRKQQQDAIAMSNDSEWWDGYIAATKDILALWEK